MRLNMDNQPPKGAKYFLDGTWYKIGVHDKPFRWSGTEWMLTQKPVSEVRGGTHINRMFA